MNFTRGIKEIRWRILNEILLEENTSHPTIFRGLAWVSL